MISQPPFFSSPQNPPSTREEETENKPNNNKRKKYSYLIQMSCNHLADHLKSLSVQEKKGKLTVPTEINAVHTTKVNRIQNTQEWAKRKRERNMFRERGGQGEGLKSIYPLHSFTFPNFPQFIIPLPSPFLLNRPFFPILAPRRYPVPVALVVMRHALIPRSRSSRCPLGCRCWGMIHDVVIRGAVVLGRRVHAFCCCAVVRGSSGRIAVVGSDAVLMVVGVRRCCWHLRRA